MAGARRGRQPGADAHHVRPGRQTRPDGTHPALLPGYEGSSPVRQGNAAAGRIQLDVYGEVADALDVARKVGLAPSMPTWALERALTVHLEGTWTQPGQGIWEVRDPQQRFTHSKVMCWVAFDRAVKAIEQRWCT